MAATRGIIHWFGRTEYPSQLMKTTSPQPQVAAPNAEFLNKAQVANLLAVSKRTVDSLLAANQLPAVRFSRRLIRFPRQAVIDCLNARAVGRRN